MPAGTPLHRNKSPIKFLTSSLLTFSPFLRARKSDQMDLVSRGNTASESTVGEFYGRVRSRVSEAPFVFVRSIGLLE